MYKRLEDVDDDSVRRYKFVQIYQSDVIRGLMKTTIDR